MWTQIAENLCLILVPPLLAEFLGTNLHLPMPQFLICKMGLMIVK